MKKLYLVDVSSMFFRAFYAVRPLTSPSGLPTNAIYGFTSMVIKLLKDEKPDYLAFCYDLPSPSFRKTIYPDYKAHRTETPEDLVPQIPYIKRLVRAMGLPSFEVEGFEADDLIGTFSEMAKKHHCEVVIVSGDKDFGQLVRPGVILLDTMKGARIDVDGVKAKWGIRPDQFVDYLALIGDTSDNVPGVAGIGPKTAEKLLGEFETLDGVYKNLDSIKSASTRDKLFKGKENAYLSQHLVTIVKDIPLADNLESLQPKPICREELEPLLVELNFKSFAKTLFGEGPQNELSPLVQNSNTLATHDELGIPLDSVHQKPNENWKSIKLVSCDINNGHFLENIPVGAGVWAFMNERGAYIGFGCQLYALQGPPTEWGPRLTEKKWIYSGFDLKRFCRDLNIKNPIIEWDSQLAAYLIKTDEVGTFSETVAEFLLKNIPPFCSPEEEFQYHQELFEKLKREIEYNHFDSLLKKIELPLAPVLLSMEQDGVLIDTVMLKRQSEGLAQEIKVLEKSIYEMAGEEFNIASPKQLAVVLFEKLGLPPGKKTKTGFSTDNEVLEGLKSSHPVIIHLLEYRELAKLKSTYVDALPNLVNPLTGRIHTHFNQALTTTGRLSSTQPNLQNIPIRTPRGHAIRRAFIAPPARSLISLDYSQIELRILAHLTGDPGLCRAFSENLDIHSATASEIFEVPLSEVDGEMRRTAKAVNFGIAYGQGAYGLAETLGIGRTEAQDIIRRYFIRYQRVQEFMETTIADAKANGFVTTFLGRKRVLKELKSNNPMVRKFGERAAINAPVQGAASDVVKMAMLAVTEIKEVKLLLQVHDELLFECDTSIAPQVLPVLKSKMETVVELRVPLIVNGKMGQNWDEAH